MSVLPKRENLRRLVELLPARDLETAERLLEGLIALEGDPLLRALAAAPEDDEEVTEEDIAAWEEGKADVAAGRVMDTEELRRRLGI
ncbi:MAG: hypothetical protein ACYC5O_04945 [Anaerolineae bacterium]